MSLIFKFDHSKPGLRKVFKEYQELALRYVWEVGEEGVGSRNIWETVSERLTEKKKISRASIIMFLEKLRTQGVLGCKDETGKGGHRRIYYPLMDEIDFVKKLIINIIESFMEDYPRETMETLRFTNTTERSGDTPPPDSH